MEQMTDLSGRPYSALPTAFMFRASYDEGCKCRPHPWEPESLERHRRYALEAKSRKGDKKATAELKELRAKGLAAGTWASTGAQGGLKPAPIGVRRISADRLCDSWPRSRSRPW